MHYSYNVSSSLYLIQTDVTHPHARLSIPTNGTFHKLLTHATHCTKSIFHSNLPPVGFGTVNIAVGRVGSLVRFLGNPVVASGAGVVSTWTRLTDSASLHLSWLLQHRVVMCSFKSPLTPSSQV